MGKLIAKSKIDTLGVNFNLSVELLTYTQLTFAKEQLLCISTSERVLHMLFAGRNQFFNAKTTFCIIFLHYFILFFCLFCSVSDGNSCFSVKKTIHNKQK